MQKPLVPPGIEGICPSWLHGADGGACRLLYAVHQMLSLWSLYRCGSWSPRPQPLGSGGDTTPCEDTRGDHEPFFNFCQQVMVFVPASLLRYPQTLPNTVGIQWLLGAEGPTRAGPTVAPLPAACAWTRARSRGSLTGVRTALLPLIHATRAPTQGTALLQVSPTAIPF